MRLLNDAGAGGVTPEVVEQLLGGKRGRPSSSLDVKVSHGQKLTRPPKEKKSSATRQQHSMNDSKGSRNADGIPRSKFDLSALEGLSEEEIMQALQDDPELAAAAAAAAERMRKSTRPPPPKESPKRITSQHPPHLKSMIDEGVPIKQWIVLLVLLAAGLYQLRKAIVGPKAPTLMAVNVKKNPRKGANKKKARVVITNRSRSAATVQEKFTPVDEDLLVREVPVAGPVKKGTTNATKKKPRKQKAKADHKKEVQNLTNDNMSQESPDSVSTDGSSNSDAGVDDREGGEADSIPVVNDVGMESGAVDTAVVEAPCEKEEVNVSIDSVIESTNGTVVEGESTHDMSSSEEIAATSTSPKKKKKKMKNVCTTATEQPVVNETPHADATVTEPVPDEVNTLDDEALALQLQLEEEKLVEHEANLVASQNIWEEVSLKKKKK